ncbi:hypothetical protein CBY09_03315 [Acidovorax kalamii]|uniref:Uncharacterized protein n=1 Tax=Acidovorax kalamii TaxID=2004485 RepID=A0A235EPH0_9BURK|nr:hypothetical protein CBY09_03315 [Acidovorax kalamii]
MALAMLLVVVGLLAATGFCGVTGAGCAATGRVAADGAGVTVGLHAVASAGGRLDRPTTLMGGFFSLVLSWVYRQRAAELKGKGERGRPPSRLSTPLRWGGWMGLQKLECLVAFRATVPVLCAENL